MPYSEHSKRIQVKDELLALIKQCSLSWHVLQCVSILNRTIGSCHYEVDIIGGRPISSKIERIDVCNIYCDLFEQIKLVDALPTNITSMPNNPIRIRYVTWLDDINSRCHIAIPNSANCHVANTATTFYK